MGKTALVLQVVLSLPYNNIFLISTEDKAKDLEAGQNFFKQI
jgi:hypothetical protein